MSRLNLDGTVRTDHMEFVIVWILEIRTDLRIISKSIPKSVNYGFDGFGIRQSVIHPDPLLLIVILLARMPAPIVLRVIPICLCRELTPRPSSEWLLEY